MASITTGRKFFDEQISLLQQGDSDALIDAHYDEGAVLVSPTKVVHGRESLKQHFRTYLSAMGKLGVISLDAFVETDDAILFEATVRSKLGTAKVYDAFVLKGGKATHHFTGLK